MQGLSAAPPQNLVSLTSTGFYQSPAHVNIFSKNRLFSNLHQKTPAIRQIRTTQYGSSIQHRDLIFASKKPFGKPQISFEFCY
jgi:hypothetical protein